MLEKFVDENSAPHFIVDLDLFIGLWTNSRSLAADHCDDCTCASHACGNGHLASRFQFNFDSGLNDLRRHESG